MNNIAGILVILVGVLLLCNNLPKNNITPTEDITKETPYTALINGVEKKLNAHLKYTHNQDIDIDDTILSDARKSLMSSHKEGK